MNKKYYPIIIGLSAILLFIPFLGSVHLFDWDEINFAESAREMIVSGNFSRVQIDFHPFWEKPPLFFWMQVLSMKALELMNLLPGYQMLSLVYSHSLHCTLPARNYMTKSSV